MRALSRPSDLCGEVVIELLARDKGPKYETSRTRPRRDRGEKHNLLTDDGILAENVSPMTAKTNSPLNIRAIALYSGPLLAGVSALASVEFGGCSSEMGWTIAVVILCAVWWVFEPIAMAATSLIPFAVLPLCGVLTSEQVASSYGNSMILLILGGFMLSTAMQRSGAHRRIALTMVNAFSGRDQSTTNGRFVVFGFMLSAAFLSMWISNAATTLMLLPIIMAVTEGTNQARLQTCLLIGVAYAASIGGTATPIGTPPNLVFMQVYALEGFDKPSFLQWMGWMLPVVVIMLPIAGFWLTRNLKLDQPIRLPDVGAWRSEETRTLTVFAITALLWITRTGPLGGWSSWLDLPHANDASVALLAVVALHLIPNGKGEPLLTWEAAERIPWGVLLLFGGGIAIASGFKESGLSELVGQALAPLTQVHPVVMIGVICLVVTFLTEVTSNTATANLLLPILAATATASDLDPKLLMIPATISASFAFMLPVATAPNVIVFGSNRLTIREMAREGLVLNLIGAVVLTLVCSWLFAT